MKNNIYLLIVAVAAFVSSGAYNTSKPLVDKSPIDVSQVTERNLQVLPKDISDKDLRDTMKFISKALGVKCGYCHIPSKNDPKKLDFAADDYGTKLTTRFMLTMTREINKSFFVPFETPDGKTIVPNSINCMTCHNGKEKPITSAPISLDSKE